MSVATQHSPFAVGSKRLFESEENEDRLQRLDSTAASGKRYRARGSPADHRCAGDQAYSVGHATVAALRGLFPEMSDKVIADVLAEYCDNIDAAIKHLTDLRLSGQAAAAAAAAGQAATPEQQAAAAAAAAEQQAQQQQQAQAQQEQAAAAQQQQQAQAQQQAQQQRGAEGSAPPMRSADEWIDVVVSEMSAAADMADARARASKVLQAFEQAAVAHAKQAGGAPGGDAERLRGQLAEAQRENQILKRAVAIQATRMQELSGKEAEVAQLRAMLGEYQQRVHALEMQNYSLSLHLKQAADGKDSMAAGGFPKNPDVF